MGRLPNLVLGSIATALIATGVAAQTGTIPLPRLTPRAGGPHGVLALEHERTGRAHPDAVAAVNACGVRQSDVELGRDVGVEAATRDADRKRVLRVDAAGLDALVAENASRVIAHVEVVVDLDRLRDGGDLAAEARGRRAVASHPPMHPRRAQRHVD